MAWISFDSSADNAFLNIQLFKVEVKFHRRQYYSSTCTSTKCIASHDYTNDQNCVLTDSVKIIRYHTQCSLPPVQQFSTQTPNPSLRPAPLGNERHEDPPNNMKGYWFLLRERPTRTRRSVSRPTLAVPQLYCNHNPQSLLFPEPWSLLLCSYQSLGSGGERQVLGSRCVHFEV